MKSVHHHILASRPHLNKKERMIKHMKFKLNFKVNRHEWTPDCGRCRKIFFSGGQNYMTRIIQLEDREPNERFIGLTSVSEPKVERYQEWKVIDDSIRQFKIHALRIEPSVKIEDYDYEYYCNDCIIKWINEGKIILETCMQECCKCGEHFKSYEEIKNRIHVVKPLFSNNGRWVAKQSFKSLKSGNCGFYYYNLSFDGKKNYNGLLEPMMKEFLETWSYDQRRQYSFGATINDCCLWICQSCFYHIGFPLQVAEILYGYGDSIDYRNFDDSINYKNYGDDSINYKNYGDDSINYRNCGDSINYKNHCSESMSLVTDNGRCGKYKTFRGCNLPACIVLIIGDYLTPSFVTYTCKVCNKDYLDCDERPSVNVDSVGRIDRRKLEHEIRTNKKYVNYLYDLTYNIDNIIKFDYRHEKASLVNTFSKFCDIKNRDDFICWPCASRLLELGVFYFTMNIEIKWSIPGVFAGNDFPRSWNGPYYQ